MPFRFTEKVSYLLLTVTLASPFFLSMQIVSSENIHLIFLAPLWQYHWTTSFGVSFSFSPFALIYVIWFWPSLYIAKLAYDTTKKQNRERYDYAQKILLLMVFQVIFSLLLPPASGSPPPINIPLPIVGFSALGLITLTVKKLESPWEGELIGFDENTAT
ncbi:MAG: hypothetical protein JSW61_11420 [Candidatus Thorarchaeota archaeon]|nr:MAG: hypothetical protein JSW61_11420 [Candidatus Thorarchaeota archaeon]